MAPRQPGSQWASTCNETKKSLDPEKLSLMHVLETHDQTLAFITKLENECATLQKQQAVSRVQHMCQVIRPLSVAADVLSQGLAKPSSLIWGLLSLSIKASSARNEFVDMTLKTFESLLSVAPKFKDYLDVLPKSPSLEIAIVEVFTAYTSLSRQCLKTFGGSTNIVKQLKWIRFQRLFEESIRKIRKLSEKCQSEAGFELERQSSQLAEDRFRKLIAGQQEVLTALNRKQLPMGGTPQGNFIIPHPPNPAFTGRRNELEDIHEALRPTNATGQHGQKAVAICGLGGVGKSQLALEYLYQYRSTYKICLWITCDSAVKMDGDIAGILPKLGYPVLGLAQNREHFKSWFANAGSDCLIIFDNAENVQELMSFWPHSTQGSIILTSQNSSWLRKENISHSIALKSLSDMESLQLLQKTMSKQGRIIRDDQALAIVKETGGLPLAVRHIGSYLCAMNMDPTEFLKDYGDENEALAIDAWGESAPPWYSHTLSTFLNYAYGQLTDDAVALLAVVVFLDPEMISEGLFLSETRSSCSLWQNSRYKAAVRNCVQYEFLARDGQGSLSIHRQVRTYVRHRLDVTQIQEGCSLAFRSLRQVFPHQSVMAEPLSLQWNECAFWIEHLIALADGIDRFSNKHNTFDTPVEVASLLVDGAIYLWERGLLEEGRSLTVTAKSIVEGRTCDQHLVADVYSFHACILSESGELTAALRFFELEKEKRAECWQAAKASKRPGDQFDQIRLANAYNNLAGVCCSLGRFGDADVYNEISLEIKNHWSDRLNVQYLQSLSYQNLGILYGQKGDFDTAASHFDQAIRLGANTSYTLRTALTYHNYGCMQVLRGQVETARRLFEKAYELRNSSLGDHYDTAATLHMLAGCYHSSKDQPSLLLAQQLLLEALRILQSKACSSDPRRVARTLFKLSLVLDDIGDTTAEAVRQEAVSLAHTIGVMCIDEASFDALVSYV